MVGLKNYWDGDNLISPFGMFKWTVQNVSNDYIIPHLSLAPSKEANLSWSPETRRGTNTFVN